MKNTRKRPQGEENEMIFQVWRVFSRFSSEQSFDGDRLIEEIFAKDDKTLASRCAGLYGVGDYVALQKSQYREGFALSHWVIKVRPEGQQDARQVQPSRDLLNFLYQNADRDGGIIGNYNNELSEAALTSRYLRKLREVKKKRVIIKKTGKKPDLVVDMAEDLLSDGNKTDEEIQKELLRKFLPTIWSNLDPDRETNEHMAKEEAIKKIASARKRKQPSRQQAGSKHTQ